MSGTAISFAASEEMIEAVKTLRERDFNHVDVYSPYHVKKLEALLPTRPSRVSRAVFLAVALGALAAYGFMYWSAVRLYPFDVAGTPHHSWPAFLPVTFEFGVLMGSITAFFSVLFFSGLPRYHHPVFDIEGFHRVTRDRFVIVVEGVSPTALPQFEKGTIHEF